MFNSTLLSQVRSRFVHIDNCPVQGDRVFFENAGGALTLNSVVDTTARYAAIPDNQGRDNPASKALVAVIDRSKADIRTLFGTAGGTVFVGESGTELLFRLIRSVVVAAPEGGTVLGSTLEHPATRSAAAHWAGVTGRQHVLVEHDNETGTVEQSAYQAAITPETCVATILHTSPVTGMSVDVGEIASVIRSVSPDCRIIVDGIQHAAHGALYIDEYDIDGYVISPYKVFSRHGYGVAWVSDRISTLAHERLEGSADDQWEFGTRDTGAYATMSDVVAYFDWLGSNFTNATSSRARIEAAGYEILAQERHLVELMLHGVGEQRGLAGMPGVEIIGGVDNPRREGLVAFHMPSRASTDVVAHLNDDGVRTHVRRADYYSSNVLAPLGLESCIRVSMCHYNAPDEVLKFLQSMEKLL